MKQYHIPIIYNGKKVYYVIQGSVVVDASSSEAKKIVPLFGRRVLYEGEEYFITRMGEKIILEKEIPTHLLIMRSYFSKLICNMRAIKPYIIFDILDDVRVRVTLVDDLVDTKVISSGIVTTEDIATYGKPNNALDIVVDFYQKCKEKGVEFDFDSCKSE